MEVELLLRGLSAIMCIFFALCTWVHLRRYTTFGFYVSMLFMWASAAFAKLAIYNQGGLP